MTAKVQRLPKAPVRKKRERQHNTPEVQAFIEKLVLTDIPSIDTCTYLYGDHSPPEVCGKPVVADWYKHRTVKGVTRWVRISCLCKMHDDRACIWILRVPDSEMRRVDVL